ncbi:DASH complex subunit Duo1 [Histoplasma capsulatum H143]|uniref:DASH complex subunit DUO1 n=1 Tax=Ajellomyces capsulatus (strain H143) TaxID=544712 RepID=C6H1G6_AJECH|nr:DASH complex subunit Duo1 [Histoplasma capsulatum H143]
MSISSARAEMEKLQFLDQNNEALPESPSKNPDFPSVPQNSSAAPEANYGRNNESQHDREEAREFSCGVNWKNVSRTVASASTLLNTWTRILAQTEQNQRLILNPSWQGASKDIADIEGESILRQQEVERIELELQQRREAMARKAEEEERKKEATSAARGSRGLARGRSRILGRTPSTTSSFGTTRGTATARGTTATRGTTTRGTTSLRRPAASAPGTRGRGKVPGSS